MNNTLLAPPICFLIVLSVITLLAALLSKLSFKTKNPPADIGTSYACGENAETNLMQPDYSQFFPFAFFFTILHVVALTVATIPVATMSSFAMAILYLAGALIGLVILLRR